MIKLDIGPIAPSRKTLKKGIEFNIMVVGESGLGKTTLINTLLNTNMRSSLSNHKELEKTVTIEVNTLELEERGSKIRLSIIDTPGFGNSLNNSNAIEPLVTYIDSQLANYFQDEIGLNRRSLVDNRVHICLYFIEPMHRGLKPLDIKFMQAVQNKVNVFPLLAKADAYTNQELIDMKRQVIKDLSSHEIKIYEFPECDSDDDPDFVKINEEMKV
uniref:Septin-2 (Trinotate prediction) n=1 Tax=Henneguya salminicola TaxID=69463 RepID=A0A6G3MFK1_HENSL